jgi:hypothetical protein
LKSAQVKSIAKEVEVGRKVDEESIRGKRRRGATRKKGNKRMPQRVRGGRMERG